MALLGSFYSRPMMRNDETGMFEYPLALDEPFTRQEVNEVIALTLRGLCIRHELKRDDWTFWPSDLLRERFSFPEQVPF